MSDFSRPSRFQVRAAIILFLVAFAAATGPIAIRQAQLVGVHSLALIAIRLLLGSLALTPFALRRHRKEILSMPRRLWLYVILAGCMLAGNIIMLVLSLEYTSVLVSSVLRRTSPLWVISLEVIFLGAAFRRNVWWGVGLTLVGSVLVAFGAAGAVEAGSRPVLGAGLALFGSICSCLYLISGRAFRDRLPSLAYIWLIFTVAAVVGLLLAWAAGVSLTGYTLEGYFWVLVVTVVAQLMGHVLLNLSLQFTPATYASIATQAGLVLSAVLAFFFFGQIPSWLQVGGSSLIIGGILMVSVRRQTMQAAKVEG
jgi:drug/metabolite transporter (DMT)-like permease